jgi:quercetin dioxygenase-like cupin family protein
MKKANIDELKLSDVRPGVTRRSFSGAGATLAWGTLSPGHEPRPHTHPHEQIVYIVSGHGQFTVGDETVFNPRRDDYYAIDEGDSGA